MELQEKQPIQEEPIQEITDSKKRLKREYEDFIKYKPADAWGGPINGNYYKWKISFYGPKDTDYEDGLFNVEIQIPENYPENGPSCFFLHQELYHPNVSQINRRICLGDYFQTNWKSSITLNEVINQIYSMLQNPCYDDSYDKIVGETYKSDPQAFHQIVREFVKIYAPKS